MINGSPIAQQLLRNWARHDWEKPAIGLIVCESAGRDEVRYALAGLEEKIFVAEYQVRLPTVEKIKERLQELASDVDDDEASSALYEPTADEEAV